MREVVDRAAAVFERDLGCTVERADPGWEDPYEALLTMILAESDLAGMRRLADELGDRMSPHLVDVLRVDWTAEQLTNAETALVLGIKEQAACNRYVRALERLATLVKADTRVIAASGRTLTGKEIVRHRDIYQKLYSTLIGYLNMGLGPEDTVQRNPLKEYGTEFGDPSAFLYGANRSMMIAYVPD